MQTNARSEPSAVEGQWRVLKIEMRSVASDLCGICWMLMTETKENMLGQQLQKTKSMKMRRRFSDGSIKKKPNTADTKDKRSDSDSYDHGMLLHEISEHVGQSRCSSVIESKYLLGTTVILWCSSLIWISLFLCFFVSFAFIRPALPFILWSIWVDLPMRLKWLRLREGRCFAVVVTITSIPFPVDSKHFLSNFLQVTMTLKIS